MDQQIGGYITGDSFSMGLWVMVLLLTAAAAVVALRKKNA